MNEFERQTKDAIQEKVDELALANYEGTIKGVLIIVADKDNTFRLMQAYNSNDFLAINAGIDLAKMGLIQAIVNSTKVRNDDNG